MSFTSLTKSDSLWLLVNDLSSSIARILRSFFGKLLYLSLISDIGVVITPPLQLLVRVQSFLFAISFNGLNTIVLVSCHVPGPDDVSVWNAVFTASLTPIPPLILVLFFLIVLLALFVLPPFPRLLIVLFRVLFCPLGAIRSWCRKRKTVGGWFGFACLGSKYSDSDLSTQIPVSQTFFKSLSPTPHSPIPQPTDFEYPNSRFSNFFQITFTHPSLPDSATYRFSILSEGFYFVSMLFDTMQEGIAGLVGSRYVCFERSTQVLKLQSEYSNHHLSTQTPISQTLPNHFHLPFSFRFSSSQCGSPHLCKRGMAGLVGLFVPVGTYAVPHLSTQNTI